VLEFWVFANYNRCRIPEKNHIKFDEWPCFKTQGRKFLLNSGWSLTGICLSSFLGRIKLFCTFAIMKLLIFCFLWIIPCFTLAQIKESAGIINHCVQKVSLAPAFTDSLANHIIEYSKSLLKTPYVYGMSSIKGFDCSGFVSTVFKRFGIFLSRSSRDMVGSGRRIDFSCLKKGDLLFFTRTNRHRKGVSHVAIVEEVKNNEVFIIHSVPKAGVKIDNLNNPYYKKRLFKAERLMILDTIQKK
jgi:murein DD-endopeptidase / murein LD-carboxypeptidase